MHSKSFVKRNNALEEFSHEVLWRVMRLRIAFGTRRTARCSLKNGLSSAIDACESS